MYSWGVFIIGNTEKRVFLQSEPLQYKTLIPSGFVIDIHRLRISWEERTAIDGSSGVRKQLNWNRQICPNWSKSWHCWFIFKAI